MTWTSTLALGLVLVGLTLVRPGFWRWVRQYVVRLAGTLLIFTGLISIMVQWFNTLADHPTTTWFIRSSAIEEVGPW